MGEASLKRELGVVTLTLYGLGVIVGAGIYVLVGKIAGLLGGATWMAFVGAAVAALPTGLSYAELSSRYPRAAGEAVFADRAFGSAGVSFLVGYLVLASGVVSTATLGHGFAGYFASIAGLQDAWRPLLIVVFLGLLSALNHRGIKEAAWLNGVCTVLSVSALLVIAAVGAPQWGAVDPLQPSSPVDPSLLPSAAVLAAVALAFYAYIGFEDICNVAEEVVDPHRTIPRAILLSLGIGALIYTVVGLTVVAVVPPAELAQSSAPLVEVSQRLLPAVPGAWLGVIALLAVTNSALFNLIMASRILYGMARNGWLPPVFAEVHETRGTPTWGIVAAFALAVLFALTGVLEVLAQSTNAIVLAVFFSVNLALLVVRLRGVGPDEPGQPHFRVWLGVPVIGIAATVWLIVQFSGDAYARAGIVALVGLILFAVQAIARRRARG